MGHCLSSASTAALLLIGTASPLFDGPEQLSRPPAFHELNLNGEPNDAGIALIRAYRGRQDYLIDLTGPTLSARTKGWWRRHTLRNAELIGTTIDVRDRTGRTFTLRLAAIGTTRYWAEPLESVATYSFTYMSAKHPTPQPLCVSGGNEAILFAGDRYDSERKSLVATGDATAGWMNIACAGTALAKLFLTRHTEASQVVATSVAERQAMLKMFTADICGDGTSFTVAGQPLLWADARRITRFMSRQASIEAVWNERGAVCLDTPRRPEFAAQIASRCGPLPRCTTERGYVISANPK